MDGQAFLERIEAEVLRMGGGIKRGMIEKRELLGDEEIRVSLRSASFLGSVELFTLRRLKPDDYHLMLLAVPRVRKEGVPVPSGTEGKFEHAPPMKGGPYDPDGRGVHQKPE